MGKQKRCEEAFLEGYKPAVVAITNNKYFKELLKYPHVTPVNDNPHTYIFFQNEELKDSYTTKMMGIKWDFGSYECHYHLGIALGFPERSVRAYADWRVAEERLGKYPEEEEKQSIGISWAGFSFTSYLDFIEQEVLWMWQTYKNSITIENSFCLWGKEEGYIEIPCGDVTRLNEVCEYIKNTRDLTPTVTT